MLPRGTAAASPTKRRPRRKAALSVAVPGRSITRRAARAFLDNAAPGGRGGRSPGDRRLQRFAGKEALGHGPGAPHPRPATGTLALGQLPIMASVAGEHVIGRHISYVGGRDLSASRISILENVAYGLKHQARSRPAKYEGRALQHFERRIAEARHAPAIRCSTSTRNGSTFESAGVERPWPA